MLSFNTTIIRLQQLPQISPKRQKFFFFFPLKYLFPEREKKKILNKEDKIWNKQKGTDIF